MEDEHQPLVRRDRVAQALTDGARELGRGLLAELAEPARGTLEVGARRRVRVREEQMSDGRRLCGL